MNSRELLNTEIAELMEIDADGPTITALRELDSLLNIASAYFAQDHTGDKGAEGEESCVECGILARLRQAGY